MAREQSTSKIRKVMMEPKIYAIMVKSSLGNVLHVGVYYSLDEAYIAARKRLQDMLPHHPSESVDIDLWDCLSAGEAIIGLTGSITRPKTYLLETAPMAGATASIPPILKELFSMAANPGVVPRKEPKPTVPAYVQSLKTAKNELMKKIIDDGDITALEKIKSAFTRNEIRLIEREIEKKTPKSNPQEGA